MLTRKNTLKALTLLALGMSAEVTHAAYIVGSLSFSGGLDTLGSVTSVVHDLNTVSGLGTGVVNTGTSDYSGVINGSAAPLANLNISTPFGVFGTTMFSVDGFSFIAKQLTVGPTRTGFSGLSAPTHSDSLAFEVIGSVLKAGFDPSKFTANFTAQGTCTAIPSDTVCNGNYSSSWSVSLSSTGLPAPGAAPAPTSLYLMGAGLLAMEVGRRRKPAKKDTVDFNAVAMAC